MSNTTKIANASHVVTSPDGTRKWYVGDQLHRDDGPAVEWPDGISEWYLNGNEVAQEDVLRNAPSI
jgi:hypothetical protein